MKSNASVLAAASTVLLAVMVGMTACSQSPPAEPSAITPASPTAATPTASPPNQSSSPQRDQPAPASQPSPGNQSAPATAQPLATTARNVESCVVRMARVDDANPPLNVRSTPTTEGDNVVGQLKNGTFVTVTNDQNGWFQISTPLKGWVSQNQTMHGCNQKVERVQLGASSEPVAIADRFIGPGSHTYKVSVKQGQTLTITRDHGPFPTVTAPDGTVLLGHSPQETQSNWSGQLSQSGDYTVGMESNFKGYKYAFSLQLK